MRAPTTELPLFTWSPPSKVVAFPLVRRRTLIERTANNVAHRGHALGSRNPVVTGEKLLRAAVATQRTIMERRGIDAETIEAELAQFETAVRVLAARLLAEGDAA